MSRYLTALDKIYLFNFLTAIGPHVFHSLVQGSVFFLVDVFEQVQAKKDDDNVGKERDNVRRDIRIFSEAVRHGHEDIIKNKKEQAVKRARKFSLRLPPDPQRDGQEYKGK